MKAMIDLQYTLFIFAYLLLVNLPYVIVANLLIVAGYVVYRRMKATTDRESFILRELRRSMLVLIAVTTIATYTTVFLVQAGADKLEQARKDKATAQELSSQRAAMEADRQQEKSKVCTPDFDTADARQLKGILTGVGAHGIYVAEIYGDGMQAAPRMIALCDGAILTKDGQASVVEELRVGQQVTVYMLKDGWRFTQRVEQ